MESISIFTAFLFGILSFISPCVLPIIPGYLSFISGLSLEQMQKGDRKENLKKVLYNSIFFVLGFSVIFTLLGASATIIGQFLLSNLAIAGKIAGIFIVLLGIHLTGLIKLNFLNYEKRIHTQKKSFGIFGSFLVGLAFAFGWTPCIGPILAGILAIASQQETVYQGILLLSVYSLGLGIPFLITAVSLNAFFTLFDKVKRYFRIVEIVSGVLLIAVGILMVTDSLTIIANYLIRLFPFLGEIG
ncbi:MAG: Cytochrome c-type biogenesis protein CcdA [Ignavibacteriae bacterium]|nr:MAG: Cytochrome c-type biogenesis protein CcdA [Ignavibacteriota bacterium]